MSDIQIINPCSYPHWDSLLETSDQTTFFHTAAWAKVLREAPVKWLSDVTGPAGGEII
jgi:hypothetical protein